MLPLRDTIRSQSFPAVNTGLLAICGLIFLLQCQQGDEMLWNWGLVPYRISNPSERLNSDFERLAAESSGSDSLVRSVLWDFCLPMLHAMATLLTSMFLHGGLLHLLGNMWFLYIFGDNIEDRFGHRQYLLFYLFSGVFAAVCHVLFAPISIVPTVGASGAVAGVMGAYLRLFPRSTVVTLVPVWVIPYIVEIPAKYFLGIWFLIQLWQGSTMFSSPVVGGIAWWAHIGGFLYGWLVANWFLKRRPDQFGRAIVTRPASEHPLYRNRSDQS